MKSKNNLPDNTANKHKYPVNSQSYENDSLQYNSQDLDQEQKVDVNPVQLNTQNVNVYVDPPKTDYSGKITGITLRRKDNEVLQYVDIYLYFGHKCGLPVYETTSDCNGNFAIENIPPGYYIIHAQCGSNLKCESPYIKVLPGQSVHQTLVLSYEKSPSARS
ncbi:carboxypeptidase-like regulatory domain-containing protein [Acetivibrio clariflavus]|nr:carboxypeptidase-like regulatory domain-containing protein [Acetivibrio clariflavus]